ncbi:hypothetical protein R5R35_010815 [Gryllus longicercus]|uniref:PiggyBac transposable element-derived protein domain-containing protein n=1 Tax=Gryllus longicercus TaxID=2509291 RepID=A0AAN9WHC7_9ORTH
MAGKTMTPDELCAILENETNEEYYSFDDSLLDPLWSPVESEDESEGNLSDELQHLELEEVESLNQEEAEGEESESRNEEWMEFTGRHKSFPFSGKSGLQKYISPDIMLFDAFHFFLNDVALYYIVTETNRYAE